MRQGTARAVAAFLVIVGWVVVTVVVGQFWSNATGPRSIEVPISERVQLPLAVAVAYLVAAVFLFRWWDVGFGAPRPLRALRLLWFPSLYVVGFLALGLAIGFPPANTLLIILANTVMVGLSEELACRGILFQGFRSRFSVWPAILWSTFLFGAVHVLNGFATGDFLASSVQAFTAFMTGIVFMAIRVRTGSLYPGMVLHAVWDFALVATAVSLAARYGTAAPGEYHPALLLIPVAFIVPNFLYGLYLLRHATRDEEPTQAP